MQREARGVVKRRRRRRSRHRLALPSDEHNQLHVAVAAALGGAWYAGSCGGAAASPVSTAAVVSAAAAWDNDTGDAALKNENISAGVGKFIRRGNMMMWTRRVSPAMLRRRLRRAEWS